MENGNSLPLIAGVEEVVVGHIRIMTEISRSLKDEPQWSRMKRSTLGYQKAEDTWFA